MQMNNQAQTNKNEQKEVEEQKQKVKQLLPFLSETTLGYRCKDISGEKNTFTAHVEIEPKQKLKIKRSLQIPVDLRIEAKDNDQLNLKILYDGNEKNF